MSFFEGYALDQVKIPTWLTEKQVATMTNMCIQTLRNDRHRRKGIPYYKMGRMVRYKLEDVCEFMEARRIETNPE